MIVAGIDPGVHTGIAVVRVSGGGQELMNFGTVEWSWEERGRLRLAQGLSVKKNFWHPFASKDVQAVVMGLPGSSHRISGRDPRVLTKCTLTGGLAAGLLLGRSMHVEYYAYDEVAALRAVATVRKCKGPYRAISPTNADVWTAFWIYYPEAKNMIEQRPKYEHVRDAALFALCVRFLRGDVNE